MTKSLRRILVVVVVVIAVGLALFLGLRRSLPARLVQHYSLDAMMVEASTMDECAECHEGEKFHTCGTCHDDHGAIELAEVPFYAVVAFTGDVPEPGFVLVDDVLPYRDQPHTHIPLLTFLADQGVDDFVSVTLASEDGGFVTIERDQLTTDALLLPYEDGIRFAAPGLHISAWIKGITRVIVVGQATPLTIDGETTSMGRLLTGPTRSVTLEQTDVMFKSEEDGEIREAKTASRLEGASVSDIVGNPTFATLHVRTAAGESVEIAATDARGALLAHLRDEITLVLPVRARSEWIRGVTELVSE